MRTWCHLLLMLRSSCCREAGRHFFKNKMVGGKKGKKITIMNYFIIIKFALFSQRHSNIKCSTVRAQLISCDVGPLEYRWTRFHFFLNCIKVKKKKKKKNFDSVWCLSFYEFDDLQSEIRILRKHLICITHRKEKKKQKLHGSCAVVLLLFILFKFFSPRVSQNWIRAPPLSAACCHRGQVGLWE